jgi:hypothetical protein
MDRFSETILFGTGCIDRNEDGSPFFPEPEMEQCQSCGARVSSRVRATWDPDLLVGSCCEIAEPDTEPDVPVSPAVYQEILSAHTVSEVSEAFRNSRKKEVA